METVLDAIQQRYACHQFVAGQPVSASELALLLEAGRLAPSAFGLEPWRFIRVEDETGRAAIARSCYDQPTAATAAARRPPLPPPPPALAPHWLQNPAAAESLAPHWLQKRPLMAAPQCWQKFPLPGLPHSGQVCLAPPPPPPLIGATR